MSAPRRAQPQAQRSRSGSSALSTPVAQRLMRVLPVLLPALALLPLLMGLVADPLSLVLWAALIPLLAGVGAGLWATRRLGAVDRLHRTSQATQALLDREEGVRIYADEGGTLVAANGEGRDAWRAKATVIEAPFEVTRGSLDPLDSETPKPESNAEGSGGAEPVGAEAEAVAVVEAKQAVATAFAGLLDGLEARLHDDLPDSRDLFDRLQEAERLGVSETIDLPLRDPGDPEGEPEWLRVSVTGVAGEPGARIWQSRDVTARRAIDEVLTREREELADFLFFLPVGLYSTDANGTLRYINQRLAHWLGLEPDDLGGSRIEDWVDGDPPDPDGEWEGTLTFKPRYDAPFLAAVRQSTFDDAGDIRTRSVVMRLSERVEAASEGSWSKRRPWLFDAAPVGIGLIGPDGLLTDCNTSFLDMLGRVRDDVLDRPLSEFIHAEERDAVQQQIDLVLTGRVERRQADLRLQLTPSVEPQDSPEERAVTLYLSPMTLDGAEVNLIAPQGRFQEGLPPEGVVAHLIDVTERKSLEQQFAQAQKMQAMGQLAGGVAHDFNNLLTAMIGFSDLLLQRHGTGDPSFTDIMQIKQNANRAANLVRQLLAFSRRQPLRPRLLDVVDGLSELSHLLRRLLGERVELKLAHGREAGHIRVDPGQFDQVVINLAVNARDAMPNGGVLTISTRRDTLERPERRGAAGTVPAGDWVVIDVTDTGEGISREHLSRLFEPFFTTKAEGTAGSGTGLGLSTVYGIIRQTEGYIFVDSTQGEGATFTIYLPRFEGDEAEDHEVESDAILNAGESVPSQDPGETPEAVSEDAAEAPQPKRRPRRRKKTEEDGDDLTGRGTILLVEDEDAVRVFGARALRNKGYEVAEARSGEGALEVLDGGLAIDLLITDMVMPGMDGAALATRIRTLKPGLPIILISGYSEDVIQGDVVNQPGTHFLPKPFSLKQLAAKVRDVLGQADEPKNGNNG